MVSELRYGGDVLFETFSGRAENLGDLINRFVAHRKPLSYEVASTIALPGNVVVVIFAYVPNEKIVGKAANDAS